MQVGCVKGEQEGETLNHTAMAQQRSWTVREPKWALRPATFPHKKQSASQIKKEVGLKPNLKKIRPEVVEAERAPVK